MYERTIARASVRLIALAFSGFGLFAFGAAAQPASDTDDIQSFYLDTVKDVIAVSHEGKVAILPMPEGVTPLNGPGLALISQVRDQTGAIIGVASELEDFSASGGPASGEAWDTYWTINVFGRGSLFLYEKEQVLPEHIKIFSDIRGGDADWTGNDTKATNVGPAPHGYGRVIGGTGEFEGATGVFEEIITMRRFTTTGLLDATIEIRVRREPAQ